MLFFLSSTFILQFAQVILTNPSLDVSRHGWTVVDGVLKTLDHLRRKKIDVCASSSPRAYFRDVAMLAARSYLSEDELKEFFNTEHQTDDQESPFQDDLFDEMTSRIRNGESLDDMMRNHMVDIVKKVVDQNQLVGDDIIDVYCQFHLASSIAYKILRIAHESYLDLKPFVSRHPNNFFESRMARTLVNAVEARLVISIKRVFSSNAFIGRPLLSGLISAVLIHDFGRGSNLEDIIIRKIEQTVFAIEKDFRPPSFNSGIVPQEEHHLFEKFVMAEWEFLCHNVNERGLWCRFRITFIHVIVVSVIVALFSILCLAFCLRKARRASVYQKLAEDVQDSKKLPTL